MKHRRRKHIRHIRSLVVLGISGLLILIGGGTLWMATLNIPDLNSFQARKISSSTKIYDRTGTVLLYDTGTNTKRTVVPLDAISPLIQKATIAIEDSNFYNNNGIEISSIIRAIIADIATGQLSQGASTITQQVVKNALLTQDKTFTRKIKELVLAIKLTRVMSKDAILEAYFNETAYGGTVYGVEQACQTFFGHPAIDVSLAEAAYIAAIPQAPTYYSPYGPHRDGLDARQKLVLQRMKTLGLITKEEYESALKEKVIFLSKNSEGIRAPHFVMFVRDYLTQKYGSDSVSSAGLKVVTSLDYSMQQKAEEIVTKFGESLQSNFNASNTAMVAIDPKTGDILTMVGSRDYFDPSIDGNYNIALAKRQPGSTFKPFVYATAFKKGYTPETVLFDVKTEFSTECDEKGQPKNPSDDPKKVCYSPGEYDDKFEGPLTIRQSLAQSRNIPAVKALYLAGINNSIQTAHDLGINSLNDPDRYGLTLVLGGGEVSLLELTSAYGVFANDGIRNPYRIVLEVSDSKGNVLEKAELNPNQVIDPNIARNISDILSDNAVRMNSLRQITDNIGRQVAVKTGTTNDYRDVWTVGYTPSLVVGAWAGKNDNTPMQHNVAGLIISPLWGAFMAQVARDFPPENFQPPMPTSNDLKPVLRGIWQGGVSYKIDTISQKLATQYTPIETQKEIVFPNVHSILHWVNKDDPTGAIPTDPSKDSQYLYWEYGVREWFKTWQVAHPEFKETTNTSVPITATDDIHVASKAPKIKILYPPQDSVLDPNTIINVQLGLSGSYPAKKTELYVNSKYILTNEHDPLNISFIPKDVGDLSTTNTASFIVYDSVMNKTQASFDFSVQ